MAIQRILIDDATALLRRQAESLGRSGAVEEAFAAWLLLDTAGSAFEVSVGVSHALGQVGALRQYRDVAFLGFAAELGVHDDEVRPALAAGLKWLIGRTPFAPDSVASFEIDSIALLGIALGVRHTESAVAEQARKWLNDLLPRSAALPRIDSFDKVLFGASEYLMSGEARPAADLGPATAEIRTALRARGVQFTSPTEADDELLVLHRVCEPQPVPPLPVRACVRLAAITWIRRHLPTMDLQRATPQDVIRLLQRFEASMRRWTWEDRPRTSGKGKVAVRWDVSNEYHVQNILWATLAPVFPDLEDEENLPSFGHKHPRFDLGIPSLRTIVEVKFIRTGQSSAFASVIGEAAEDASLYRSSNSGYDKLVLFIWDDSRTSEQHEELIQGLLKIDGIIGAVVASRPGRMSQESSGA